MILSIANILAALAFVGTMGAFWRGTVWIYTGHFWGIHRRSFYSKNGLTDMDTDVPEETTPPPDLSQRSRPSTLAKRAVA
jgi:hypothetical protein